ncbi:MAG: A/G-specific adenine glycosylase [Hyphomicrobiales bacterium]
MDMWQARGAKTARGKRGDNPVPARVAPLLLAWYDRSRRRLPWRAPPGGTADPYRVWLSEIMLQQTTVKAVAPYFEAFLRRWPDVAALAAAPLDDILAAWAGLGYYTRARKLHECARAVVQRHGGRFPSTEAGLLELPGIGPYTAAAMAAIAFGRPATVVDGNVERVVSRLFAVETPLPDAKPGLRALAASIASDTRPGDFAQAMMDLGATVCRPRAPACAICPLIGICAARRKGLQAELPRRRPKPEKPLRRGVAFLVLRRDGAVLLRRRPDKGLLGGMLEAPSTPWQAEMPGDPLASAPVAARWRKTDGTVRHTFTHFHLELEVWRADVAASSRVAARAAPGRCLWIPRDELEDAALPSVMRKVIAHGLG